MAAIFGDSKGVVLCDCLEQGNTT